MKELEKKILQLLREHSQLTCSQINEALYGASDETTKIYAQLRELEKRGDVTRIPGRPIRYALVQTHFEFSSIQIARNVQNTLGGFSTDRFEAVSASAEAAQLPGPGTALLERILHTADYQGNTDENVVAMKIAQVDIIGQTRLSEAAPGMTVSRMASFIVKQLPDFDLRVSRRDDSLVEELAGLGEDRHLLTFASKYCHWHNRFVFQRDDYSVFDPVVQQALPYFLSQAGLTWKGRIITADMLGLLQNTNQYTLFNLLVDQVLRHVSSPDKKARFDRILRYYYDQILHK